MSDEAGAADSTQLGHMTFQFFPPIPPGLPLGLFPISFLIWLRYFHLNLNIVVCIYVIFYLWQVFWWIDSPSVFTKVITSLLPVNFDVLRFLRWHCQLSHYPIIGLNIRPCAFWRTMFSIWRYPMVSVMVVVGYISKVSIIKATGV